jgi:steroid delta-isomerase-like uncharacterized protein
MNAKGIVKGWFDAIEARDVERVLGALADDVEVEVEAMDRPFVGKDALRALMANSMGAYESLRIEPQKILASGSEVAVLARGRAKLRSDLEILGEKLPTAGKELSVTAALFVTVNAAGKIAKLTRVRDNLEVARQLGIPADRMQSLVEKLEHRMAA